MEIIYGNGSVDLFGCEYENIIITIEYEGNIHLSHDYQEFKNINGFLKKKTNFKNNSLISKGIDRIVIYLKNNKTENAELFKYIGYFKILRVKTNKLKADAKFRNKSINFINKMETPLNDLDTPLNELNASYVYGRIIRKLRR